MKIASTFRALASIIAVAGLTHCGTTSETPAPTGTAAAATASEAAPAAATEDGDITNPAQARKETHLTKAAAKVQNGVTTRRDIVGKLGIFYTKGTNASGQATGVWKFSPTRSTAKAFIPGSAFIPGAMVTYYQSLSVVFDANDVVVSHSFLESTKEKTGLGFSYGS